MSTADDVQLLIDFGLLNEEGIQRLATLVRGLQAVLGSPAAPAGAAKALRGPAPRSSGRQLAQDESLDAPEVSRRRRRVAGITAEVLSTYRQQGRTTAQIAAELGVSVPTVNVYLRRFGLTNPRRGRPARN